MRRAGLATLAIATACGSSEPVQEVMPYVESAYAAAPAGNGPTAMYLAIRNDGSAGTSLTAVESGVAARVELHTQVREDGLVRMQRLDSIPIPAGGELRMRPGASHVMLMDLTVDLEPGDTIDAVLVLSSGERVPARVPVVSYARLADLFEREGSNPREGRD